MTTSDELLLVGRINGLYGVRGWVKVFSYTDPLENILQYAPWQLRRHNQLQAHQLNDGKRHGKGIVVQLQGYEDRDLATALLGSEILVYQHQLPQLTDEYYWSQLIGLKVINQDDQDFGVVDYLVETGSNDVIVVKGERERLIPYLPDQVIQEINLAEGYLRVDWDAEF